MKALDWHRQLQTQHAQYGKSVFTITELANLSGSSPRTLNVELARLQARGVIVHYARNCYGLPEVVTPEALLPLLDTGAYITGLYALYRHNLATQSPAEITCFTNRRHNRSRIRQTPVGRFAFICVSAQVYHTPSDDLLAPPEQAMCDFCTLCLRKGIAPESLATLRNLNRLDLSTLCSLASHYPCTVQRTLNRLIRMPAATPPRGIPTSA